MAYRKLGLLAHQRKALLRNAVTSLLESEKITTTKPGPKRSAHSGQDDHPGKTGDLHARRQTVPI